MNERKSRLPSPVEVCTGQTLPLGGTQARDGDDRTTLPLHVGPKVTLQRTVFVAKGPGPMPARPPIPTTLHGMFGHVERPAARVGAAPPPLSPRRKAREASASEAGGAPSERAATSRTADAERDSAPAISRPERPAETRPAQVSMDAPECGPDEPTTPKEPEESTGELLVIEPQPTATTLPLALSRTLRAGYETSNPTEVAVRWEALKAELIAHASRLHPGDTGVFELPDTEPSDDDDTPAVWPTALGGALVALMLGLSLWPIHLTSTADGTFSRYARLVGEKSQLQSHVATVHVERGQHVASQTPLIALSTDTIEREAAELDLALEKTLAARDQAEQMQAQQRAELGLKHAEGMRGINERVAMQRAELAGLEDKRAKLIASNSSPLKLAAVDDQVDAARAALREREAEQQRIDQQLTASLVLTSEAETERLTREAALLSEKRAALEYELHAAVVSASQPGTVAEVLTAEGEPVEDEQVLVRIIPDDLPLTLIARFTDVEANELTRAASATLTFGSETAPSASHRARIVRVTREVSRQSRSAAATAVGGRWSRSPISVELMLDDSRCAPELVKRLAKAPDVHIELGRRRTLLSMLAEALRSPAALP